MITNSMMSWGEIPDSSFLFRTFDNLKWYNMISDDDIIYINNTLYDVLEGIDDLNLEDYKKARLVFMYMNENPAFAWTINLNKHECLDYSYMQRVVPYLSDYLVNMDNITAGREISLFIAKGTYETLTGSCVDVRYHTDKDIIQKIADIMFVYTHLLRIDSNSSVQDMDSIVYEMLDKVVDILDESFIDLGIEELLDDYIRNLRHDPSEIEYDEVFQEEYEYIRDEFMSYILNVLNYAMYRDSPIIKENSDRITTLLSRFKGMEYDILPILSTILSFIYREALFTISLFYQDQIVYKYHDSYEFTKFIRFLYKDNLISY